jgi:hypothetical protein
LKLQIEKQLRIKAHFSTKANGSFPTQDEIVRPQDDIIHLDALIADGHVQPRVTQLEQLKFVDLKQFA